MRKVLFLFCFISVTAVAQYDYNLPPNFSLFRWAPEDDSLALDIGPNKKWFGHIFLSYGLSATGAEGDAASVNHKGGNFEYGLRGKLKINNILAFGCDLKYDRLAYQIKQTGDKTFPDSSKFDKQKFAIHNVAAEVFIRINHDPIFGRKRGDYLGSYIDFGGYFGYGFSMRQVVKTTDQNNGDNLKIVRTGMDYLERISYGYSARLGFSHFIIYGKYRVSNYVDQDVYNFAFPRLTIGLQAAIFEN